MASKPIFSAPQIRILQDTVRKARKRFRTQEELALALGITQPALSSLLKGRWKPGLSTAKAIAHLESTALEDLVGPIGADIANGEAALTQIQARYPNLEACIRFYIGTKSWSEWTIAAARAGVCGDKDLPPPAWPEKLDMIEKLLKQIHRTT